MKVEAGKIYRCRDGKKARVYATDGQGSRPVHGAVWLDSTNHWSTKPGKECWYMTVWCLDGGYYEEVFSKIESPLDLVEEWIE